MAESNEVTKSSRSTRKQSTKQKDLATAPTVGDTDQQDGCRCSCKDAIMDIHKKLDKILQSLETIEKRVTYLEIKLDDTKTQVTIQRKEIDEIKLAVNMMERNQQNTTVLINKKDDAHHRVTSRLEDQIDDLQNRSRRNNIVIHGVPEGSEGNKSCEEFVSDLLTNHMKLDGGDTIEIERAHRSPGRVQPSNNGTASRARPRPIHCRLLRYTDRQHIIKSASRCLRNNKFKGSNIYISDDVTPKIREARKDLRLRHLPSIRRDERVQFAFIPMSIPPVITYKLHTVQFKTFRHGDAGVAV